MEKWAVGLIRTSHYRVSIGGMTSWKIPDTNILSDQIKQGTVDVKALDTTVAAMLRTKFALGLFESKSSILLTQIMKLSCSSLFLRPLPIL